MEIFGILCSIPVGFVLSVAYCAIVSHAIVRHEFLSRSFSLASLAILFGFACEVVLLTTLGAVRSRAIIGPAFSVAHDIFFILGTPALANVLLLHKRAWRQRSSHADNAARQAFFVVRHWPLAAIVCTIFAFCLVILQYDVSETLYGIDGTNGPYSRQPFFEL